MRTTAEQNEKSVTTDTEASVLSTPLAGPLTTSSRSNATSMRMSRNCPEVTNVGRLCRNPILPAPVAISTAAAMKVGEPLLTTVHSPFRLSRLPLRQLHSLVPNTLRWEVNMARPWFRARPVSFVALIALLGLTGCVYEPPGYGGDGYGGGYSDGGGQYYGDGQYYDNGGQYDGYGGQSYGYGGGGYYGNGYGNNYGYRGYGYGYQPYRYQPQEHHRHRHGGDYCRYHRCGEDDNGD
jgi:hypothetical protein